MGFPIFQSTHGEPRYVQQRHGERRMSATIEEREAEAQALPAIAMKPLLVFQHIGCETPGIFLDLLEKQKRPVETVRLYEGDRTPEDLSPYSGLLVMGGPMSVNDEADYPWLRAEDRLLKEALALDVPTLGICLGSQLIAKAAGGTIRQGPRKERAYEPYRELYETTVQLLPPPDLLIYLRASVETLLSRIARRGRDFERKIAPDYLKGLNDLYESWISDFVLCPVLTIPSDDLAYVAHPGHLDLIVAKIGGKLIGNEEVVFEVEEVERATRS